MKILNLYFKNINSLEGESRIHFDKAPIADGGVFAITGPNGSGKSSILDAITLGLYGETFRFNRPAEHVMTKETAESFAEVEFALADNKYRASWQVTRSDGNAAGELSAPKMQLLLLNGTEQVLENTPQKVREKMAELTGMDFHKFSKSMVLAQGDFAAFLNALDSERMDILEKISGSDIYQDYARQAEEKYNQTQTQLQQLEQDLSATPVMDDASREASEHDLSDFIEQQAELEIEQNEIQLLLSWVQTIDSLEKENDNLGKQQQQTSTELEQTQQTLELIDASESVLAFEDELTAFDNKTAEVQQSKKTLDSFRSEAQMLQQQLKSANFDESSTLTTLTASQLKENTDKLTLKLSELKLSLPREAALLQSLDQQKQQQSSALAEAEAWLQEHAIDKTLVEDFPEIEKLTQLRSQLVELSSKLSADLKWSKNITQALTSKKAEIDSITVKNTQLTEKITENETSFKALVKDSSIEELQEMLEEQKERVLNFQELHDLASVNSKLSKKGIFNFLFARNDLKEEAELNKELNRLQLEIAREKNIVSTLEAAVFNEALLRKMQDDRQYLVDGKPCPLCGALEHPYAKHAPAASNSRQVLADQKKKVRELTAEENSINRQITTVQQHSEKNEQKDDKLKNVRSQWNALANKLNTLSLELTIDNLSLMKDLVAAEKDELSNLTKLEKQARKLQVSIEQAQDSIAANNVTLDRVSKELATVTAEWEGRPQESVEMEKTYTQTVEQEKALSEKIEKQLSVLGESMPKKKKEQAFFAQLNSRKQQYQKKQLEQQTLAEEIKSLSEKISICSQSIETLEKNIQQYSDTAQQEEVASLHLALVEKQKLIADKEKAFAQQEAELNSIKKSLQDKIKGTVTSDLTALRETLALIHKKAEIQQNQLSLSEKIIALNNKQQEIQSKLESEKANALTQQSEYDLTGQQSVIKRKLDITKQEVTTLQNKLAKQSSMQQKQEQVLAKIAEQKRELEKCEADKQLINAENGIHFRRKVQQIISDKLMSQTNQVLEKISGRYYLRKVESEHGLAIEIEDTKQHNVRRLPKTLSGGESFIVSLALALGLAEMSNNGHALDSLFLDEGFGNLDAESLYLVMTTLESLQTHGKVVGVISHVDGVQKRIKTQIEMIKKPNGLSALKMVS